MSTHQNCYLANKVRGNFNTANLYLPTGNLDSKSGGEVMRMLEEIHQRFGKTLVVITHDSRIARRAGRQFVIEDGRLSEVSEAHKELLA